MKTIVAFVACSVLGLGAWAATLRQAPPQQKFEPRRVYTPVSPEAIVLFRGEGQLAGGTTTITLPDGFERHVMPADRSVQLTCRGAWSPLWASDVVDGKFTVSTQLTGRLDQQFWWEVKAVARWAAEGRPADFQR